jgi:hypothetical protein
MTALPEIKQAAQQLKRNKGAIRRSIDKLSARQGVYRRLFFGADGNIKPDAAIFFDEFAKMAGMGVPGFSSDPVVMGRLSGARDMFLHMLSGLDLDQAEIGDLEVQLRKLEKEKS